MKYLRKFNTEADVMMFVQPNVVLVADTENVMFNVPMPNGVYIQHIDGTLYTTDQWTSLGSANDQANGVAVIGTNAKFVIAKTSLGRTSWSSDPNNKVEGVMCSVNSLTAMTDYAGEANTALIVVDDTYGAAYKCANFTFPNGAKGYLPALGEWVEAYAYKADIDAAMALIGGTSFGTNYYWSSTQVSASEAWALHGNTGRKYELNKSKSEVTYIPRAFTALNI